MFSKKSQKIISTLYTDIFYNIKGKVAKQGLIIFFAQKKWMHISTHPLIYNLFVKRLLYLSNDSLERFGVVHREVSEDLTIDFDTSLVERAHELRV